MHRRRLAVSSLSNFVQFQRLNLLEAAVFDMFNVGSQCSRNHADVKFISHTAASARITRNRRAAVSAQFYRKMLEKRFYMCATSNDALLVV